jgi:hypothetical protein
MTLTKDNGVEGLFGSLGMGALLENFTLNVTTSDNLKNTASLKAMTFGGVVGSVANSATIRKVTVQGTLEFHHYAPNSLGVAMGGLIGSIPVNAPGTVDIEQCVSKVNVNIKSSTGNNGHTSGIGGLIGNSHGKVNIRNSYSTGNIYVKAAGNVFLGLGGIVGVQGSANGIAVPWNLLIENCYSSGEIVMDCTGRTSWANPPGVGGIFGMVRRASDITIRNSAALNPKLLVLTTGGYEGSPFINRLYGYTHLTPYNSATFTNNVALLGMRTGGTAIDDESCENNEPGALIETAVRTTGSLGTAGYGVSASDLRLSATWTNSAGDLTAFSGLGWDTDIWNFSNVTTLGRPVLR